MDSFLKNIETEYATEYGKHLKNFSEPKIYHGGDSFDISKRWYVYYSFRNPDTNILERQRPIYAKANQIYKTKAQRIAYLERVRVTLKKLLNKGYTPSQMIVEPYKITEAQLDFALKQKKQILKDTTLRDYSDRLRHFKEYLNSKGLLQMPIHEIKRAIITGFLNDVLKKSGARNRNNTKTVLSSLFSVLEENEIIPINFVKTIKSLKTSPTRNKTYTDIESKELFDYLNKNDSHLLLFVKFVSYAFLRPIEACRLKVGDINFNDKTLTVRAKNKALKTKVIPDVLFVELDFLKKEDRNAWIFSHHGVAVSDTDEINRRDYYSKKFLKVKKVFGFGVDHTIYSFRHTFITKLYRNLRKRFSPYQAKSELMLITGHSSMTALEKYLRDIDAELPKDYSEDLK